MHAVPVDRSGTQNRDHPHVGLLACYVNACALRAGLLCVHLSDIFAPQLLARPNLVPVLLTSQPQRPCCSRTSDARNAEAKLLVVCSPASSVTMLIRSPCRQPTSLTGPYGPRFCTRTTYTMTAAYLNEHNDTRQARVSLTQRQCSTEACSCMHQ